MHERSVRDLLNLYNPANPLEKAWTIPAPWYFDERLAQLERESVFAANWQVAGHMDQVREPGQFFTMDVNNEPLVVVRGDDGKLRAFYNVCRHHAAAVVPETQGCVKNFRCPYHGWTYGNDGSLKGMVEFEGVCNFDRADNGLMPVRVDTWENFVFVNLDGRAAPLSEFLGKIPELVAPLKITETLKYFDRRIYTLNCNWKVYVDNYLEGYHIPIVHTGLMKEIDYPRYRTEVFRYASQQLGPVKEVKPGDTGERVYAPGPGSKEALYFWIFPNLMVNIYPDNISTNLIVPLGHDRTLTIFEWYFHDAHSEKVRERVRKAIGFSETVQQEDIHICEAVQRGLQSSTYDRGRYSVKRENGVHHFHLLLSEFLEEK